MIARIPSQFHQLIGKDISWVGHCPWSGALAFGTETGELLSVVSTENDIELIQVTEDAVNGAAFVGETAAFSSRTSIAILRQQEPQHMRATPLFERSSGAHGVAVASDGAFLFATGPDGVLLVSPNHQSEAYSAVSIQNPDAPFYAYQLTRIGAHEKGEVFVCAARSHGVIVFVYQGGTKLSSASTHFFPGKDIVSVGGVSDPEFPLGMMALTLKGEILFISNVLQSGAPRAVHFSEITGVPYAATTAKGGILLLTSNELVVIPDALTQLKSAEVRIAKQRVWIVPAKATEMFAVGDDSLFMISEGVADEFHVSELFAGQAVISDNQSAQSRTSSVESRTISELFARPDWEPSESKLVLAQVGLLAAD